MNMNAFLSSSVQWNPDSPVQQNAEFSADEKASFCDHDNLSLLEETPLCCCQETIFYDQSIAEFSTDEMTSLYHYANPSLSVCSRAGARCTNTIISMFSVSMLLMPFFLGWGTKKRNTVLPVYAQVNLLEMKEWKHPAIKTQSIKRPPPRRKESTGRSETTRKEDRIRERFNCLWTWVKMEEEPENLRCQFDEETRREEVKLKKPGSKKAHLTVRKRNMLCLARKKKDKLPTITE
jgi:hypothetical protein